MDRPGLLSKHNARREPVEAPRGADAPQGLEIASVSYWYGDLHVLADIDIVVRPGDVVSVLGPSGAGKSTLLHICAGLVQPAAGQVVLDGRDVTGLTGNVSYMQQRDLLLPWLRVIDNVALSLELQGVPRPEAREEVAPLFADFGIAGFEYHYPAQLSGGMRQRTALLRTYVASRHMLLLDEPFGSLDTITRSGMHGWLLELIGRISSGVLLVTHDVDEALLLSDHIVLLSDRPARVIRTIAVDLPRPRSTHAFLDTKYHDLRRLILAALGGIEPQART